MKQYTTLFYFSIIFFLYSCHSSDREIVFYEWKNKNTLSKIEKKYLKELDVQEVYLRFFDLTREENSGYIYPISVIREIDSTFKNLHIVPVIYIENDVFKEKYDLDQLPLQVSKLINQISERHFQAIPTKIQIDCDWTKETQAAYFVFLDSLHKKYTLSATIRLHQIKYPDQTGVPPADEVTLMAYNMGDLRDSAMNSIFSLPILKQYINKNTTYPLPVDIALPIYSWGVITLPNKQLKLINNLSTQTIIGDTKNYKKINSYTFSVKNPVFLNGFYLLPNTQIKVEEVNIREVLQGNDYLLKTCTKMNWSNKVLLYHLDEHVLTHQNLTYLTKLKLPC